MNNSNTAPPAQKVTKDEIVAAIDQICEKRGQPVVRISDIAELESIDAGEQAIGNKLDELHELGRVNLFEYGQKGVWWTPEDIELDSEVEVGVVNWDNIDAAEIPDDLLAELPEFQDQTYWEGAKDTWGTVSVGAFFFVGVGFLILGIRQYLSVQLPQGGQTFFSISVVGALSVGILSLALVFAMEALQILEEWGALDRVRGAIRDAKHRIIREIRDQLPDIDP